METLTTGSLAYFDCPAGLIPCKITAITGNPGPASSSQDVTITLTATRGAYPRGESRTVWALHVVPRKSVFVRGGKYRIHYYEVQP